MLCTKHTFNLDSKITDDWGGSHRLALNLEAQKDTTDWEIELSLPDEYKIDQIYGAKINREGGKTFISGEDWNKNLEKGKSLEVVLIVDEGSKKDSAPILPEFIFADSDNNADSIEETNYSNDFDLKSTITDDWGGSHRVVLDLQALKSATNWKVPLSMSDDYTIDQIYGGKLIQEDGKTYISGEDWNKDLAKGKNAEIVLIVDEGKSASKAPIAPQILGDIATRSIGEDTSNQNDDQSTSAPQASSAPELSFDSNVVQDWNGGYKLEANLKAESNAKNWEVDFSLPQDYNISEFYGVDLVKNSNGSYTISGQNDQKSLQQGQSIKPIFIVQDNGQVAIAPKATFDESQPSQTSQPEVSQPQADNNLNTPNNGEDIIAQPSSGQTVINVDSDFDGNLANAIAASQDGDVVKLGSNIYYTDGLTVNKDITIDGQQGSIIDGQGTSSSIIYLDQGATGATIQDVEIRNGNNGIFGSNARNLTLQNLDVNNIGITQTIRDGQNNTGINLNHAEGLKLLNSKIHNIGRKGASVGDTDGAFISGLSIHNVNLAAQHAQSHDAAGIKFFNTNDVTVKDSYFSDINAMGIWNDTTNGTVIDNNEVVNVGEDFLAPSFNNNVNISGIYNEKSSNSVVKNNKANSVAERFAAFNATEFTMETMTLEDNNDFSSTNLGSTDYWVNESAEKLIAVTEDPDAANFSLFADEYNAQANIGT